MARICRICVSILACTLVLMVVQCKKPHIVLIVADDMGFNDIGYNNKYILTPNLDKLAKGGVILNQAYVQQVCSPSRASLLTGYYAYHVGIQNGALGGSSPYGLPLQYKLLPQMLNELGYKTHMVGKWHLGYCHWKYTPNERGFESFLGFYLSSIDYYKHTASLGDSEGIDFRDNRRLASEMNGTYATTAFEQRAVTIIQNHDKNNPLFLYLPFNAPHSPLQVPQKYLNMYTQRVNPKRKTYAAMVTALDDTIGNIVDTLGKQGMADDTLIVFTSDNGPGGSGNAAPLRGRKQTLFEGGSRVPAFVNGPMLKKKRYVSDGMLHISDWLPTLVHIAGGKVDHQLTNATYGGNSAEANCNFPFAYKGVSYSNCITDGHDRLWCSTTANYDTDKKWGNCKDKMPLDGVNQWPMLSEGKPSSRNEFVYNIKDTSGRRNDAKMASGAAIRVGDYKLIIGDATGVGPGNRNGWTEDPFSSGTKRPVRPSQNNKVDNNAVYLFNLKDDPNEKTNIAVRHPELVSRLKSKLASYSVTATPAVTGRPSSGSNPENWGGAISPGWCKVNVEEIIG